MGKIVKRFKVLIQIEEVKLPWLAEQTGIDKKRWANVKSGHLEMRASEVEALAEIWPEYAYWITTGEELPECGQISPLAKAAKDSS